MQTLSPLDVVETIVEQTGQQIHYDDFGHKSLWSSGGKISENGDLAYFKPIPEHFAPHEYFRGKECVQFQSFDRQWTFSADGFAHKGGMPELLEDKAEIISALSEALSIFKSNILRLKSK